jgi:hypothetical protein
VFTNDEKARIREIVREEIAAYWSSVGRSEVAAPVVTLAPGSDPKDVARAVERVLSERMRRGGSMRLMRDRDEPPAVDWL